MSFQGDLLRAGIDSDGKSIKLIGYGGAHAARLFGAGTAASPATWATSGNMLQFYLKSTYASGGTRGMYLRTYFDSGASGDCFRAFATVNATTGTVQGSHLSLSFATGAKITGLGVAARCTWHIPNEVVGAGGTYAALQAEVFCDGTASSPASVTQHSIIRAIVDGGDATARARVKNFLSLAQIGSGSGNMLETGLTAATVNAACTKALRIIVDGVAHWFPVATAIT